MMGNARVTRFTDSMDQIDGRAMIQNSIIYPDIPLPTVDKNSKILDRLTHEDDNDSLELEPDNDSYPDNRVFQLFSDDYQRLRWAETDEVGR